MLLQHALESISLLCFVKQQLYYQNQMTPRHTIFGKKLYMTCINTFMPSILFCDPQFDRTFTCHYNFPLLIWDVWTKKITFGILTHLFNKLSVSDPNNDVKVSIRGYVTRQGRSQDFSKGGGVILCQSEGTHQIGMSTSTPCLGLMWYVSDEQWE